MKKANKENRVTITQVAKHAGVTIGTVSHVINGTAPITKETADRVHQAIRELNYVPNVMAKSLRSKKSYMVGLLIPNLNNSFHSKVASTFVDKAYENGYSVLILGYEYSLERERRELNRLESNNIDIIVIFNGCGDEKEIKSYLKKGISVILADRSTELIDVPYIQYDNKKVMYDIVKMLRRKGYKRIGFFSEPLELTNLKDRYDGYRQALREFGYNFREEYVFIRENLQLDNLENGYCYMKEILQTHKKEELPDAWIASSDLLAIGIMRAFTECGYKIPDDFGVVGFDNTEISGYVNPRMTTVNQDQRLLGESLWNMVQQISNGKKEIENVILSQQLVERESC
ncbi:MAG: LacI family DNA-binding transcriptional regulator [Eubacteriales bacterium]|nr:LacI family DNA-binding transcriptional regulator [Eubacteriales bacterium]